jgi:hypothetical protein
MSPKTLLRILIISLFVLLSIFLFYKLIHPGLIREVVRIGDNTELIRYYSGKERLRQIDRKKMLTKKFDRISFADDSMAIYFKDGYRGFLSVNTGKVITPPVYTHVWQFAENKAFVTNEKDQFGIINRQGQLIIPFKYKYIENVADLLEDQVYSFSDGRCIITDNHDFGLIDSLGKELLAPVYQNITTEPKGFYSVLKNNKWGLFDSTFSKILNNEYDNISVLVSGLLVKKDEIETLYSLDGKNIISEIVYSDCFPLQYVSSESESSYSSDDSDDESYYGSEEESDPEPAFTPRLCSGWTVVRKAQGAGLMRNADKKIIIECQYDEIMAISESLFRCRLDYESYILVDKNGQVVR